MQTALFGGGVLWMVNVIIAIDLFYFESFLTANTSFEVFYIKPLWFSLKGQDNKFLKVRHS